MKSSLTRRVFITAIIKEPALPWFFPISRWIRRYLQRHPAQGPLALPPVAAY